MGSSDGFGWDYWLRWQVVASALAFVVPAAASLYVVFNRRVNAPPLSFDHLWLSCFINLSPVWLLCYRAFAFFVLSVFLCRTVSQFGPSLFYFYTQWTFALVIVYFGLGTIISARGCWMWSLKPTSKNRESEEQGALVNKFKAKDRKQRAGFWGYLMHVIYQTCAGAVILTDVVFWCLLVPLMANVTFRLDLVIAGMHSINALFLIIDTSINSVPFSWFGLANFVLWTTTYGVFQWVIHICGIVTWWPYPFMDLSKPSAPLWYMAMALIHIPFYGIYMLLLNTKISLFTRFFPFVFRRH